MFNRSFNLTPFVKDIPSLALRKSAWLSLVGSVNASLFGAADAVAQKLVAEGIEPGEFKELTVREIRALCQGPETGPSKDTLAAARKLYKLHVEWRDELLRTSIVSTGRKADDTLGSIASTITMMTGPQKEREITTQAVPTLAALGIVVTPEQIAAAKKQRLADDNHFATMRKARAGMIEYIIDNLFASNDTNYDEDDENYSTLDVETKEYLCNKLIVSLNRAMNNAINNTLYGRTGDAVVGVGDYVIAQKLIPQLMDAMSTTAERKVTKRVRKAKKVKAPVVQRAPKPTQETKVTTVSDNGIKVTRPVTV